MNRYSFRQVHDKAHRRVRGLWQRGKTYYVQTTVKHPTTGLKHVTKIALPDADSLEKAKIEAAKIKDSASKGEILTGKDAGPTFAEYRQHYRENNHKAPKTAMNEDHFLLAWERFLGADCRIRAINPTNILAYRTELLQGHSARTGNLHLGALKQMLLMAKTEGHIAKLPTEGIKQIRVKTEERPLIEKGVIEKMADEAIANHPRTGKQFSDYLYFLIYSGARCSEALKLKWSDIDWQNRQVCFRGEISKGQARRLDFNTPLEEHLLAMKTTATGEYLFPSGRTETNITSFKVIMEIIKKTLNIHFHFHLTRHFFISNCVMKGIDFMTIAKGVTGRIKTSHLGSNQNQPP